MYKFLHYDCLKVLAPEYEEKCIASFSLEYGKSVCCLCGEVITEDRKGNGLTLLHDEYGVTRLLKALK